ncbi:CLUMA_CG016343, isoform B [Clunio marinus]|uniref:CLUMA_CG016343, isoform B n=1 Tax=Clunio marinus TaxID=568069 RepID=A0A1J1ITB2_9DIPT|nr:CLUMA_CG016343, isoform B [Clunio marinus]
MSKMISNYKKISFIILEILLLSDKLMTSTQESIKLLQENEDDMKKQEKLSTHVANLERLLKKYKSNLNIVNQRVTVNIHKIVQSQREMFKLRTHQKNFGKICQQVGVIIRGDGYSLPEDQSMDVEENFMKIAGKTEDIIRISNDENVKSNMKIITDRVKSFVNEKQKNSLAGSKVKEEDDKVNNNIISAKDMPCSSIPVTANTSLDTKDIPNIKKGDEDGDKEVSEVSKLIETIEDTPISLNSELTVPVEYPEIGKRPKKLLDEEHSMDGEKRNVDGNFYKKKLKYESPLDFLRLSKNKLTTKENDIT